MIHQLFLKVPALLLGMLTISAGQTHPVRSEKAAGETKQLRIVCVSSLGPDQEVILASRDGKGNWEERGKFDLRSSLITEWLPARAGELHLAVREMGTLKSICQFTYPADSRRALAVLGADTEKKTYNVTVVDPDKLGFVKGSVLIFNCNTHAGLVSLGSGETKVEAGNQLVAKPTLADNGTYHLTVSYLDSDEKPVACYDRQASSEANSRDMLFLMPDKALGMRVLSLPLFEALD